MAALALLAAAIAAASAAESGSSACPRGSACEVGARSPSKDGFLEENIAWRPLFGELSSHEFFDTIWERKHARIVPPEEFAFDDQLLVPPALLDAVLELDARAETRSSSSPPSPSSSSSSSSSSAEGGQSPPPLERAHLVRIKQGSGHGGRVEVKESLPRSRGELDAAFKQQGLLLRVPAANFRFGAISQLAFHLADRVFGFPVLATLEYVPAAAAASAPCSVRWVSTFVVQLRGRRRIKIFDLGVPLPRIYHELNDASRSPERNRSDLLAMEAGSVLYVPPGKCFEFSGRPRGDSLQLVLHVDVTLQDTWAALAHVALELLREAEAALSQSGPSSAPRLNDPFPRCSLEAPHGEEGVEAYPWASVMQWVLVELGSREAEPLLRHSLPVLDWVRFDPANTSAVLPPGIAAGWRRVMDGVIERASLKAAIVRLRNIKASGPQVGGMMNEALGPDLVRLFAPVAMSSFIKGFNCLRTPAIAAGLRARFGLLRDNGDVLRALRRMRGVRLAAIDAFSQRQMSTLRELEQLGATVRGRDEL